MAPSPDSCRRSRIRRRRSTSVVASPAAYLTVLALQLALSSGYGPTAWTTPRRGVVSMNCGGSVPGWGSRERRSLDYRCRGFHAEVANSLVERRRSRVMASIDAGAEGGGMAMPQEGRVGGRMTGGNNTNTNSYSSNDGSNSSKNNNKKAISVDVESDNLYSVLGLPVGSTAAEIKDAYRRMAQRVHPDSDGGSADRDKFEAVTAAYDVLSDPGKRSTYDQGLAMKSFVDKVKAGNWGKTLMAVANLGAAATSVGVSAGVAAAQPLAKDLARGFEDFTVKGLQSAKPVEAVEALARERQAVERTKLEAQRKMTALDQRTGEAVAEAAALEETREKRLQEQKDWNVTLAASQKETADKKQALVEIRSKVEEAEKVVSGNRAKEQEAMEKFRRSKLARDSFVQASTSSERKVSAAEAAVQGAEQRLAEAVKALDNARRGLESASEQASELEGRRGQVVGEGVSAEEAFIEAKGLTSASRTSLTEHQNNQTAVQVELREKGRLEVVAAAKVKELGDLAEAAGARALQLRNSADKSKAASQRNAEAIETANRQDSRLRAESLAAAAAQEAAAAAAEEEKARLEREEAAAAAAEAVGRARAAESAAAEAAEAAIAAAAAARQATADAVAVAEAGERRALEQAGSESRSRAGQGVEMRKGVGEGVRMGEEVGVGEGDGLNIEAGGSPPSEASKREAGGATIESEGGGGGGGWGGGGAADDGGDRSAVAAAAGGGVMEDK